MKKAMLTAVVLSLMFAFVQMAVAETAPAFDPQSLVGEWWCDWKASMFPSATGKIYITVKSVENSRVLGEKEVTGSKLEYGVHKFEGTLKDNVLNIPKSTELTVEGKRMTGFAYGTMKNDITCQKQK